MSNGTAFPGDGRFMDEDERADKSEMWKEYMALREEAGVLATRSMVKLGEGSPRDAGVLAILSISQRLEALTYLISKAKVF